MEAILKTLLLTGALLASSAFASFSIDKIKTTTFPSLNVLKMHSQDVENEKLGNAPRFAIVHDVTINPMTSSDWTVEGTNLVWRHRIQATSAASINVAFETFKMSQNSQLSIYSTDRNVTIRPFTAADNNVARELWTPVIESEEIMVELKVPANEMNLVELVLTKINQGYRTFSQTTEKSGSCNKDVVCSEGDGWRNEINTVAVISTGGSTFCTGFMVNNTRNDKTPFFMTANHCRVSSSRAPSLVTYWNYQAAKCGGSRNGRKTEFNTGAQHLANHARSDFSLVKLNQQPSDSYNVQYAGWDRSGEDATSATAIHHPATDEKSISFENQPTTATYYLKEVLVEDATHVRVEDWDVGTTEPGSSGSPLFDQNHRVIGQLHGGYASCSSQTSDWYGRFFVSWEGGGTTSTSLKSHLDPDSTGDMFTDTL
jgi:lysyl endopeptidase